MSTLSADQKKNLFAQYGGNETNTGSIEGQIALFTQRIQDISNHLQSNKKDHASRRSLLKLVGKRKRLLQYLSKHNLEGYRALIQQLNLRK